MKSLNPQDVPNEAPSSENADGVNDVNDPSRMAVWEHLDDLRKVLVRSLLAIATMFTVVYYRSNDVMHILEKPLLDILKTMPPNSADIVVLGVPDMFTIYFKVSAIAATFLSVPFLLYQLWRFISPALYAHERKFVFPFLFAGTLAFAAGLAFAYFVVIPMGYKFLIEFGRDNMTIGAVKPMIDLRDYIDLTLKMLFAVGLIFETPVLIVLLGRFGIVSAPMLSRFRRHAMLMSALVAAIATPSPDAFTMIIVMVPLYLLYEISIIGVKLTGRSR